MRWLVPPSLSLVEKAFSTSSIHSTQGAMTSALARDSRRFFSVSPWYLL